MTNDVTAPAVTPPRPQPARRFTEQFTFLTDTATAEFLTGQAVITAKREGHPGPKLGEAVRELLDKAIGDIHVTDPHAYAEVVRVGRREIERRRKERGNKG
jgi:hypothetical protein